LETLRLWANPLRHSSTILTTLTPFFSLALATVEGVATDSFQPFQWFAMVMAVSGLNLVWRAFEERSWVMSYLGVALVVGAYMILLGLFDVDQPLLFVVPAGAYLLAVAYLEWRRGTRVPVRMLETGGLVLLLGFTLVLSISEVATFRDGQGHIYYSLFLFFGSLGVFLWGALIHWKRPFIAGIAVFVANFFTLLGLPIQLVEEWWWIVLGIALVFIGGAVFLERYRERLMALGREWAERLEEWY
ncbi:MAG: SCO7613 C-terminal domain-containing membrane protein, partial [Dehalococcoidia bacterium]